MAYWCFKKGCEYEAQYVCLCLCSETYCCEFHLNAHLKLRYRTHAFDSILTEPCKWTQAEILNFLKKEKFKKEKLRQIVRVTKKWNCNRSLKESSSAVDSDLKKIKDLIRKFSRVSEKEEDLLLNPSILMSNTDAERVNGTLTNNWELYRRVMLFCKSRLLRNKKWAILNRVNNDLETEQDFRRTCEFYKNLTSDPLFREVYNEYINAYQRLTSLYQFSFDDDTPKLFIYNTETGSEETKILEFKRWGRIYTKTRFPNGDLFFIVNCSSFIIDMNFRVWEIPVPRRSSSHAIVFNRSIYYFEIIDFSWRFDLDENRYSRFATLPARLLQFDICSIIEFNGDILISGMQYSCLLLHSIDIDSFSEIPYKLEHTWAWRGLLKAEERLYLIACECQGGIYESEVGNPFSWTQVTHERIDQYCDYFSYNKGAIYISSIGTADTRDYFKFDLASKVLTDIDCYNSH